MEISRVTKYNITSFVDCVLNLVINSINERATAIAIRINAVERKIQVVDNGVGWRESWLKKIRDLDSQGISGSWHDFCGSRKQTLISIRGLYDTMIVTSRHYRSERTYMKIFKVFEASKLIETEHRPSSGTTVTIYGFYDLSVTGKWDVERMYFLVQSIALNNPHISFTVKDDRNGKLAIGILKLQSAANILASLYKGEVTLCNLQSSGSEWTSDLKFHGYIGLNDSSSGKNQYIFLNNRPVDCPVLAEVISTTYVDVLRAYRFRIGRNIKIKEDMVFLLLYLTCAEFGFTIEDGRNILILPKMHCVLQSIRHCILKNMENNIAHNSYWNLENEDNENSPSFSILHLDSPNQFYVFASQNDASKSTCCSLKLSEWSNWTYQRDSITVEKTNNSELNGFHETCLRHGRRFNFLPKKLYDLLRYNNTKLTKVGRLSGSGGSILSAEIKCGLKDSQSVHHQEMDVRLCKPSQQFREFQLTKGLLNFITILGQINKEFIAGLILQSDVKMLLLFDQHAVHERIRYENLLDKYKLQATYNLLSVKLPYPLMLELSSETCSCIAAHKFLLKQFGISLSAINDTTITICNVPECLRKSKYYYDDVKMKLKVQKLLNEILQNVNNGIYKSSTLPLTLQNAIAMEACHGAIKFGDSLTWEHCNALLELLKHTKIPTQCAHGRPSVIPVLDLSNLERRHNFVQKKLNFGALKNSKRKRNFSHA